MELQIREADPSDAPAILAYLQDLIQEPDLDIPLAPGEFQLTITEQEELLNEMKASQNSIMYLAWVGMEIVGEISLRGGTRQAIRHEAFLGMSVRKGWRGKGIGSRLIARAVDWAQENPAIQRVELAVFARNTPAVHLYEKFGFRKEGHRRHKIFQDGQFLDDYIMARLF